MMKEFAGNIYGVNFRFHLISARPAAFTRIPALRPRAEALKTRFFRRKNNFNYF
jgi:hypothetical protein